MSQIPIIGITMGDPVGVGPEVIVKALQENEIYEIAKPMILSDFNVISKVC